MSMYVLTYVYMPVCVDVYLYACAYAFTYIVCMDVCIYACAHECMYARGSAIFVNKDQDSPRRSSMLFKIFRTLRTGARFPSTF